MTRPAPAPGDERTCLSLYPLTFVQEGDEVVIGRPDVDSFAVFPADAAAVVQRLRTGEDLASVAAWYQEAYGEPADIGDFVETLTELGFVRPAGEEEVLIAAPAPVRWQRLGTIVFSPPALVAYAVIVGIAVYLMLVTPQLQPGPSKAFFAGSLLLVLGAGAVAQLAGIAWHEWFHVLAGRRLGLPSRISIGRRMYFVVFETTLVGLMGVRSRKRILPFLAGLIADALLVSALTGVAQLGRAEDWPAWSVRIAVAFSYVTILRMIWQAMLYMETDLYHVMASALRCPDLHRMTRAYLRNRVARLRGRPERTSDESGWTARDRRTVRRYAPFVVTGSLAMIALTAVSVLPLLAGFAVRIYHGVMAGHLDSAVFWNSLLVGAGFLGQFAVVAVLAVRDRRRRLADPGSI